MGGGWLKHEAFRYWNISKPLEEYHYQDNAASRTALATPGLVNKQIKEVFCEKENFNFQEKYAVFMTKSHTYKYHIFGMI